MSYKTCITCEIKVYQNDEGKYICPGCGKEVKTPKPFGWGCA